MLAEERIKMASGRTLMVWDPDGVLHSSTGSSFAGDAPCSTDGLPDASPLWDDFGTTVQLKKGWQPN
jgi:hypothetical protein